jgi:hypothetical protein
VIRTWTCKKCGKKNERAYARCLGQDLVPPFARCSGRRPKKKIPKHREIMAVPYERWVEQFGEVCGICGAKPAKGRKLNRDHSHREPYGARGVLCQRCNRYLPYFATVDWLLNAAKYLDRPPIQRL